MASFRNMSYPYMLYEGLRNFFAVNAAGALSYLFKYMACFVQPLIAPFNAYDAARQINWLVAQCTWTIGQLTNVLNLIYDPVDQRITISQSMPQAVVAPGFAYATPLNMPGFAYVSPVGEIGFADPQPVSLLTFNVPTALSASLSQITATIAQVALAGINYAVVLF